MYAFTVKNDQGTWDIWALIEEINEPQRKQIVDNAIQSGLPIVGKNLTEFGVSVRPGATWDGVQWTGGLDIARTEEMVLNLYSLVCDNTILLTFQSIKDTIDDEMKSVIFESENSMIKVPEGQTANVGDTWDGTSVINK
jgi:hypothetical protein